LESDLPKLIHIQQTHTLRAWELNHRGAPAHTQGISQLNSLHRINRILYRLATTNKHSRLASEAHLTRPSNSTIPHLGRIFQHNSTLLVNNLTYTTSPNTVPPSNLFTLLVDRRPVELRLRNL